MLCIGCTNVIKFYKIQDTYIKLDTCIAVSALWWLSDAYIAMHVPCNLCVVWAGMLSIVRWSSWACGITWGSLQLWWSSRIRMAAVSSIEYAYFSKCWAITGKQGFIYLVPYICGIRFLRESCKTLVHFWGWPVWATNLRAEKSYFPFPNIQRAKLLTSSMHVFLILLEISHFLPSFAYVPSFSVHCLKNH